MARQEAADQTATAAVMQSADVVANADDDANAIADDDPDGDTDDDDASIVTFGLAPPTPSLDDGVVRDVATPASSSAGHTPLGHTSMGTPRELRGLASTGGLHNAAVRAARERDAVMASQLVLTSELSLAEERATKAEGREVELQDKCAGLEAEIEQLTKTLHTSALDKLQCTGAETVSSGGSSASASAGFLLFGSPFASAKGKSTKTSSASGAKGSRLLARRESR